MPRFLVFVASAVLALGLTTSTALAKGTSTGPTYVPPGQSAAAQYTEDVPTAGGNTPSSSVHHASPAAGFGGTHGGPGAGGGSSVPQKTLQAMSHSGTSGSAAAALAQALAPAATDSTVSSSPTSGGRTPHDHHGGTATAAVTKAPTTLPTATPASNTGQVLHTLTGADAGSGIGSLLPIILIATLVGATALGLARLRRPGAA